MKKQYVYRIEFKDRPEYYVGIHESENINEDLYLGSGSGLGKFLKKQYNINTQRQRIKAFKEGTIIRKILFVSDSRDQVLEKEKQIISKDVVENDKNCLNCTVGGHTRHHLGKYMESLSEKDRLLHGRKISEASKGTVCINKNGVYKRVSEEKAKDMVENENWNYGNWGKTKEHKEKTRKSCSGQKRSKEQIENIRNAKIGKVWITNGKKNRFVEKEESEQLQFGWRLGRTNWKKTKTKKPA